MATGLSDIQRLAIACGNEPYADDVVCPDCDGIGNNPPFENDGHKNRRCDRCDGKGYVTSPAIVAYDDAPTDPTHGGKIWNE